MQHATNTPQSLPDDLDVLRALVMTLTPERDSAISERDDLVAADHKLLHRLLKPNRL